MIVGIDFTGSNGTPTSTYSLHYFGANPSPYAQAIQAVGSILADYDQDKRFPLYGYGGSYHGSTSHCFPLNDNKKDPEVSGIDGVISTYRNALSRFSLSGPTYFAPVIREACHNIREDLAKPGAPKYYVLLIITDGAIDDMSDTKDAIVDAANNLPLSIVIVGVGDGNFGCMEELDGDDVRLCDRKGVGAERDIVQFVPFRDFASNPERLAQETLAEIPEQLLSYMRQKNISPLPPRTAAGGKPLQ